MIQIISALEAARSFCSQSRLWAQAYGVDDSSVTLPKCLDVVETFVYAALAEQMCWVQHERDRMQYRMHVLAEDQSVERDPVISPKMLEPAAEQSKSLTRLFDWYTDDPYQGHLLSESFYTDLVDDLWLLVQDQILQAVPQASWNIWNVKRLGRDLYIESGIDYRIYDWERIYEPKPQAVTDTYRDVPDVVPTTPYGRWFSQLQISPRTVASVVKPSQVLGSKPMAVSEGAPYLLATAQNALPHLQSLRAALQRNLGSRPDVSGAEYKRTIDGWEPLSAIYTPPAADATDTPFVSSLLKLPSTKLRFNQDAIKRAGQVLELMELMRKQNSGLRDNNHVEETDPANYRV